MSENKAGKYLKYAIGEIVLVVIGILIALSINNWNENKKEGLKELKYLERLLDDLENDNKTLTFSKQLSKDRIRQINVLEQVTKHPEMPRDSYKEIIESIEKVTWRSYLPLSRIVYNELLSSGKMALIESEKLRTELSNYYGDADHWEMILNMEDAHKQFSHATAGLLSKEILYGIESSSSLRNAKPTSGQSFEVKKDEVDRIIKVLSQNGEALKWLPSIYHYHVLADKVISNLLIKNEALKKLVQMNLNDISNNDF